MTDTSKKELPWWATLLGIMFLAFCVSVPFGITGYLGDDYGAICIGVVLLVLVCIVVGWLAKVFRTANHVIDKNDPKSKLNRSE